VGKYDLVVLDEAHRYSSGSQSGKGWASVLEDVVENSTAVLAMSGSVDQGWIGDDAVENALEERLTLCKRFSVPEAREAGVIADFAWEIQYVGADDAKAQEKLAAKTRVLREVYNDDEHKFDVTRADGSLADRIEAPFETLSNLRSFSQSKAGSETREFSEAFDEVAMAAISRRPQRWQLSPPSESIANIVVEHAPDQKVVVLTQSYSQSEEVGAAVRNRIDEDLVLVPEADSDEQFDAIQEFNDGGYEVIVGPGDVLGLGVDMPDADVAINVGKGGVNASLIQRIGRVLRNPSGEKQAQFYQLVTLPSIPEAHLYGEDGRRLIRRASEFKALGERLRELPGYAVNDERTDETVRKLEERGVAAMRSDNRPLEAIVDDNVAQRYIERLLEVFDDAPDHEEAILPKLWQSKTLRRDGHPVEEPNDDRTVRTGPETSRPDADGEPSGDEEEVAGEHRDGTKDDGRSTEEGVESDSGLLASFVSTMRGWL
jgi:superfamily II DNA or RNA helicase